MSKQKAKGGAWEREIAKRLTAQYGLPFNRNISGSGAYVGGKNIHRKMTIDAEMHRIVRGDVVVPPEMRLLNIEAKNYASFDFHLLLKGDNRQFDTWIKQMMTVADDDSVNMLALKVTRRGEYVALQWNDSQKLNHSHLWYESSSVGRWMIVEWSVFFEHHAETLRQLCSPK